MGGLRLSPDEIRTILDHLSGRAQISRRKDFERYSTGRGRIVHRHALIFSSIARYIERRAGKIKIELKDAGDGELLLTIEDPERKYRRQTRTPIEVAKFFAERFPEIFPAPKTR